MKNDKLQNLKELLALANKPYFSVEEGAKMFTELVKFVKDLKQENNSRYSEFISQVENLVKDHKRLYNDANYSEVYFKNEISSLKKALSNLKLQHGKDGEDGKDADEVDTEELALEASKRAVAECKMLIPTIPTPDTGEAIINKINEDESELIKKEKVEGLEELERKADFALSRPLMMGGGGQVLDIKAGTNVTVNKTGGIYTINSSGSGSGGQVNTVVAGTGISVNSTDPVNPVVTNSAPDQIVSITGAGTSTVTGTYPNFTVTSTGGTGGGDVTGPSSAVADNFASFDTTTGKLIKDSGKKAADFMAAGSVTQYTDEMAQDAVGNAVGNGLDYDDSTGAISVDETELSLPFLKLDQTTPQSIINGRTTFEQGLKLGTTPTVGAFAEGKMYYDAVYKCPSVNIDTDVNLQVGQEMLVRVINNSASNILNGQAVYLTGASGIFPTVALAKADADSTSFVVGLATQNINIGAEGFVNVRGMVSDINTNAWTAGDNLYLSGDTAGALTNVVPVAPLNEVRIGRVVVKSATVGSVYVNSTGLRKLTDLSDVTIATPTTDQVLRFNGTEWVNGNAVTSSASAGIEFFPDDTTIVASGTQSTYPIKTLSKTPITSAEDVDTISMTNNTVLYGTYLYNTGLGRTSLDAGVYTFDIYAGVSSATNTTSITQNVNRVRPEAGTVSFTNLTATSKTVTASTGTPFALVAIDVGGTIDTDSFLQTPKGLYRILTIVSDTVITVAVPSTYTNESTVAFSVHKKLFGVTTGEINNTATSPLFAGLQLYSITTVQPAYTLLATDKLATIFFGVSNGTRDVYFAHNGTTRYSHFSTPLITLHNNLAGLQGGTANEMYHLTSAQATVVGNTSGTNTGDNAANTSITATKLDDFATPDNNTDLDANTTNHGLLLKATAPAAGLYNYVGITNGETAYTNKALFDATVPSTQAFGDAAATGSAAVAARRDHKHAMPATPDLSGLVTKATYDANSILYATTDDTPVALTVGTNTVVGRVAGAITTLAIDSDLSSVSASDDTVPSAKATKAMGDLKLPLAGGTMTGDITLGDTTSINLGVGTGDVADITLNSSALADEHWSGTIIEAVAGATIAVGDACYLKTADGQWYLNDGILDGTDTGFKLKLGICVLAANDNGATKMLLDGLIASAAFPNFTVGAPVYLDDTAGDLIVAQPSTVNFAIRVVGTAVSQTVLHFSPSQDYIVHI